MSCGHIAMLSLSSIAFFLPIVTCQLFGNYLETGGNLTVDYVSFPGPCVNVSSYVVATNKSLYEGRWFYVYSGFNKAQVDSWSCMTWDSFFDQDKNLNDFLYVREAGTYRTVHTKSLPIDADQGTYILTGNMQQPEPSKATLFYMDAEMFVFWEVVCLSEKSHYRNCAVGFRSLELAKKKEDQMKRVLNVMKSRGGEIPLYKVRHDDRSCTYPPIRSSPFATETVSENEATTEAETEDSATETVSETEATTEDAETETETVAETVNE